MSRSASSIGHPGHNSANASYHLNKSTLSYVPNGHVSSPRQTPHNHSFLNTSATHHNLISSPLIGDNKTPSPPTHHDTSVRTDILVPLSKSGIGATTHNQSTRTDWEIYKYQHQGLSLLCLLALLMSLMAVTCLREEDDYPSRGHLRDTISLILMILTLSLDLYTLFVCSLQVTLLSKTPTAISACSRNSALCAFLISIPLFFTGMILRLDIPLPVSLSVIGIALLLCGSASVHNVYAWQRALTAHAKMTTMGDKPDLLAGSAGNTSRTGFALQLSTLV